MLITRSCYCARGVPAGRFNILMHGRVCRCVCAYTLCKFVRACIHWGRCKTNISLQTFHITNAKIKMTQISKPPYPRGICNAFIRSPPLIRRMSAPSRHLGIVFWRLIYALKLTLNTMRPLPRFQSIDFIKIVAHFG